MASIITLTTDFGLTGTYVAAMKAVILGINPEAKIVDVCHTIAPQAIHQAALAIDSVIDYFPPKTVHVVVVDPGVGTSRKGIGLRTPTAEFVAPDNGVLSYVLSRYIELDNRSQAPFAVEIPKGLEAVHLTKPEFWLPHVSSTFHGRDVFAPVAARLSLGVDPPQMGERVSRLTVLPLPKARKTTNGDLVGKVIDVDSFGNLITNIKARDLPKDTQTLTIEVARHTIRGLVSTYADREGLIALVGSTGRLEIAVKNGSAAAELEAGVGDPVLLRGLNTV